jgi:hypothetical protein
MDRGNFSRLSGEGVKKSIWFFFTSFRRKPESSFFKVLRTDWTPVFTGETAENQFFHTFGISGGRNRQGNLLLGDSKKYCRKGGEKILGGNLV